MTMQRIKSHAWKEVQKDKEETKRAVATEHEITERENKRSETRSDSIMFIIVGIIIFMLIVCAYLLNI